MLCNHFLVASCVITIASFNSFFMFSKSNKSNLLSKVFDVCFFLNIILDPFEKIGITELRRLVEEYENTIMRKTTVRKNITRKIEPHKNIMVFFVSVIEGQEETAMGGFEDLLEKENA